MDLLDFMVVMGAPVPVWPWLSASSARASTSCSESELNLKSTSSSHKQADLMIRSCVAYIFRGCAGRLK